MEKVLDVYKRPYNPMRPVVCMDESPKQLIGETRVPIPMSKGNDRKCDYQYERLGVCNIFLANEPLAGFRKVKITPKKCKVDWAEFIKEIADEHYPVAEVITLVMDNLGTHTAGALYERFAPAANLMGNHRAVQYISKKYLSEIRKRMSESGGIIRNRGKTANASAEAAAILNQLPGKIGAGSVDELADSFLLLDHCITHLVYLEAIKYYLEKGGRSRGSYIVADKERLEGADKAESDWNPELCLYDRDVENKILEVGFMNGIVRINLEKVREIPEQDLWFERVWKEYLEDIYLDC